MLDNGKNSYKITTAKVNKEDVFETEIKGSQKRVVCEGYKKVAVNRLLSIQKKDGKKEGEEES